MMNSINPFESVYQTPEVDEYFGIDQITKGRATLEIKYWILINHILHARGHINTVPRRFQTDTMLDIAGSVKYEHLLEHISATGHEIKALEYGLRDQMKHHHIPNDHLIHWGLTSQDIVDPVYTIAIRNFVQKQLISKLETILFTISKLCLSNIPFPARTHGQMAIPTTVGHEMEVYYYRLGQILTDLTVSNAKLQVKFGGAVGTLLVHKTFDPGVDWLEIFTQFFRTEFHIGMHVFTTQVNGNDDKAAVFADLVRINNVVIDLCQDIWAYASYGYLSIKRSATHVGSSTMPQKNNPIEFENVEGSLQYANAELHFMIDKLTRSRGQRDLSDSVVQRNYGLMFAKLAHSYSKLGKALGLIEFSKTAGRQDIENNGQMLAEMIQCFAKVDGTNLYEEIKERTMNKQLSLGAILDIATTSHLKAKPRISDYIEKLLTQN